MSWVITGLAASGALIGGLTNKKHPLKGAITGGLIGGTAGLGAGAIGLGAAGSAPLASGTAAFGGGTSSAGIGAGSRALTAGISPTSALSLPAGSSAGTGGFLSGLMKNDPNGNMLMQKGKGMIQEKLLQGVLGGGGQDEGSTSQEVSTFSPSGGATMTNAPSISMPISLQNDPQAMALYRQRVAQAGGSYGQY